jgi:hypothetical protein
MRWQTTAVLAALLIGLGVFYYVYEVRLAPEREKAEGRKGRVFTAETADVTEMTLKRGPELVRLKREAEGWQVLEPLKARGDRGPIEETLTNAVTAKMDREIAAQPKDLGEFGLDKPAAEVTLSLKDGKQLGLLLGAKNPTGVWVYAQERGKPSVFVVGDSVLRDATRPLADFRDKTILAFDRKDVTGLLVVTRDETLAVEPAGESGWRLTRPRALEADSETIAEFLNKLTTARIKEFVAEAPKSLQPYGLERPLRLSIHTGKDKDRATKELWLGSMDDKKKGVYAMRPGESSVLLLPDEVWSGLPKTTAAVRTKTLVAFDQAKVTKLEIESPRGAVTAVREGEQWRITAPEALPADPVESGAVLMKLKGLKALAFLSDDASGIGRYLGRPEVRATLTLAGAPAPLTILLSPSPEKRGGAATAYAAVVGRGPVVLVDGSALTEIGRSLRDLRDRTLVAGLDPKDVKRLSLKSGGKAVLLERRGESDWRILEGGKGTAKSGKADDVLYALRGLRWKDVAAPKAEEPARYGLEAPAAEVGLYRADGTEIAIVQLGKEEGDRRYVKLKSAPAVYAIDAKQFEVPKVPEDFQG